MQTFINPDIAYVLLMFGTLFVMLALLTPGTHLLEGGALIILAGAGYEILQLGFNPWAMVVLVLGLVPFIYAIRSKRREWALGLSILCLIAGSLYMFPGKGFIPAVNPIMAVIVSGLSAAFLWITVRKSLQAHQARPLQDLDDLIGRTGQAKSEIHTGGTVQVASELWSARSDKVIQTGSPIKVVRREGFTLIVEAEERH